MDFVFCYIYLPLFYLINCHRVPGAPLLSIDTALSGFTPSIGYLCGNAVICNVAAYLIWGIDGFNDPRNQFTIHVLILFLALYALLDLNKYLGYGPKRSVNWEHQVAVVTGGAGGLGWLMAKYMAERGAKVAVWDVKTPDGWSDIWTEGAHENGVKWYTCDVGNIDQVKELRDVVEQEMGTPTILINNAGVVHGQPLLSLPTSSIERSIRVNLLSHFHTVQSFLPGMLRHPTGGTIVTISSVLGHLGASHLTDYTATKAALLAFHSSLVAELNSMPISKSAPTGGKNIKTVLVKPGQLSTTMFGNLKTPSDFFGPVVNADDLARAIVDAIGHGRSAVLAFPLYARCIEWIGVLPASLQRAARWFSGVDSAMAGMTIS